MVDDLVRIQNLIKKAELESAKAEGQIESIKKEWNKRYGFDSVDEAESKLNELNDKLASLNDKVESLTNDLLTSQNWDELEKELR